MYVYRSKGGSRYIHEHLSYCGINIEKTFFSFFGLNNAQLSTERANFDVLQMAIVKSYASCRDAEGNAK